MHNSRKLDACTTEQTAPTDWSCVCSGAHAPTAHRKYQRGWGTDDCCATCTTVENWMHARLNEMASDTDADDVSTHLPAKDMSPTGPITSPRLLKRRKARGVSSITNDRVDAERAALAAEGYRNATRRAPLFSWGVVLCCLLIFSIIAWQWRSTQIWLNG